MAHGPSPDGPPTTRRSPRRLVSELRRRRVFRAAVLYAVVAFGAVEAFDVFVPALGLPESWVTIAATLAVAGFPVAVVLGWVFDLTGGALHRTAPEPDEVGDVLGPVAVSPARLVAGGVGVGILVAVVGLGAIMAGGGRATEASDIGTLAVLPFADRSASADDTYFSDGLTEELLNALARAGDVRVASRSSSFRYRGEDVDVREVGRSLRVDAVLEGSVQRDGERLRVTAQLTDAGTGYSLWADVYDAEASDLFLVQERIARQILEALGSDLTRGGSTHAGRIVQQPTANLQAYDHYLRGNYHLGRRTRDDVLRAIDEYRKAAELDTAFVSPVARQGLAHGIIADWGWTVPGMSRQDLLERGASFADRAIRLDPESGEAWLTRAYLRVVSDPYHLAGALEAFDRAIEADPGNAETHYQRGQALMVLGRFDEARDAYHRALDIEPDRTATLVSMASLASLRGDPARARLWNDSAIAVAPANVYAHVHAAVLALTEGRAEQALASARLARQLGEGHPIPVIALLAASHAAVGDSAAARQWYRQALDAAGDAAISDNNAAFLMVAASQLEDIDGAIGVLERARPGGAWLWYYLQQPVNEPLTRDPRFRRIVAGADPRR